MILQGWETETQGWAAEMTLEDSPWANDETHVIVLTQTFRVADRGTGEILASVLRTEAETSKGASWQTWGPANIAAVEKQRNG